MVQQFLSVGLSFVILLSFVSISKAFHTAPGGHDGITTEAASLKERVHNNADFQMWLSGSGGDIPALRFFSTGTNDEDSTLPWDPRIGPNGFEGGWLNHFYGPISKRGLFMAGGVSAPDAARSYMNKIKSHFCPPEI